MKYFTSIVLCMLIILIIIVHFNVQVIEGGTGPQIPNDSGQVQINTIEDMRLFLEKMYMICLLNPNDQSSPKTYNSECYKMTLLASFLWPALGPYTYYTLDEISPIFGTSTKPKSVVEESSDQQNQDTPPIPIIQNDLDYQLFTQLAIIGDLIKPFSTEPFNNWNSTVIWFKQDGKKGAINTRDACRERWGGYQGAVGLTTLYYQEIKLILAYFHGQTDSSTKVYNGDNIYTKLY